MKFLILMSLLAAAPSPEAELEKLCKILAEKDNLDPHYKSNEAAYTPNVDAYGRPVASAEVDGGYGYLLPKSLKIPVTINPENFLGGTSRPFELDVAEIGELEYDLETKELLFNGEKLEPAKVRELRRKCKTLRKK